MPTAENSARDVHGAWVELRREDRFGAVIADGELLAVSPDSLFVQTRSRFLAVAVSDVAGIWAARYQSGATLVTAWSLFGALSTVTHGYGMAISLPVWILTGAVSYSVQEHEGTLYVEASEVSEFRKYARFPQGLPERFPRAAR